MCSFFYRHLSRYLNFIICTASTQCTQCVLIIVHKVYYSLCKMCTTYYTKCVQLIIENVYSLLYKMCTTYYTKCVQLIIQNVHYPLCSELTPGQPGGIGSLGQQSRCFSSAILNHHHRHWCHHSGNIHNNCQKSSPTAIPNHLHRCQRCSHYHNDCRKAFLLPFSIIIIVIVAIIMISIIGKKALPLPFSIIVIVIVVTITIIVKTI